LLLLLLLLLLQQQRSIASWQRVECRVLTLMVDTIIVVF
jgi:hypothetical protein